MQLDNLIEDLPAIVDELQDGVAMLTTLKTYLECENPDLDTVDRLLKIFLQRQETTLSEIKSHHQCLPRENRLP